MKKNKVIHGDCLKVMKRMPDNYVDTIITDPPYGLGFMGKGWDTFDPKFINEAMCKDKRGQSLIACQRRSNTAGTYDHSRNHEFQAWCTIWAKECLRVAKPGAVLMAFGGTRTYHRLTCAIEDAGWEIRDCIQWIYGSGFPKSLDISKAIDKAAGAEREVIGYNENHREGKGGPSNMRQGVWSTEHAQPHTGEGNITAPTTSLAKLWDGWGTALKPSWEPIILAMKPLDGTYAENAEKWGVAGLWIDGSRIGTGDNLTEGQYSGKERKDGVCYGKHKNLASEKYTQPTGRFPANTIMDESAARLLDEQSGVSMSKGGGVKSHQYGLQVRKNKRKKTMVIIQDFLMSAVYHDSFTQPRHPNLNAMPGVRGWR